jgi:Xaa-Pro aminopeptidase
LILAWYYNMSSSKAYVVFRCPNCGFYSLASPKQKTRLCVRCGKTITVGDSYPRIAENFKEAQKLVGELNSKRESESLHKPRQTQSIPLELNKMNDSVKISNKGILKTFQEVVLGHEGKEVELAELLRECEVHGISREYAGKLIEKLIDGGQAYRPEKGWIKFL